MFLENQKGRKGEIREITMLPYRLKEILLCLLHGEADTQKKQRTGLWYRANITSIILTVIQCLSSSVFKRRICILRKYAIKGKKYEEIIGDSLSLNCETKFLEKDLFASMQVAYRLHRVLFICVSLWRWFFFYSNVSPKKASVAFWYAPRYI